MNMYEKNVAAFFVTWVTHNSRISERMIKFGVEKGGGARLSLEDETFISEIILEVVSGDGLEVLAYNICRDHVHMVLVCEDGELSGIVGKLKSVSSRKFHIFEEGNLSQGNSNKGACPLVGGSKGAFGCKMRW